MSFCIQMEGSFRSSVKEGLADQSVLNSQFSLLGIPLKDRRKITPDTGVGWHLCMWKHAISSYSKSMLNWSNFCIFMLIFKIILKDSRTAMLSTRQCSIFKFLLWVWDEVFSLSNKHKCEGKAAAWMIFLVRDD